MTTKKRGRGLVWFVALAAATLLGLVVVLTQVGFYRENLGDSTPVEWLPQLDLAYLTPIAVEGVAWVFTVMVAFAVVNNRPSGRYERLMWLFSSIAAGVNGWHNIHGGDWLTGVVLGGMSIAGPLIVHMTLRWDRDAQQDRTAEQIRRATIERTVRALRRGAQVGRHPIYSWRAFSIATNLNCPWDSAYRIALTGQYKAVHAVLVQQVARSLPTVRTPELESVHEDDELPVHGTVGADIFPACTDPLVADLHDVHDTRALFAIWGVHDPVHEDRARQETSENDRAQDSAPEAVHDSDEERANDTVHGVHDQDVHGARDALHDRAPKRAQGSARRRAQDRAPSKSERAQHTSKGRAREVVHARAERQDETAARFWHAARRRGVDISALTRAQVVERIGINNTTAVTRGFAKAESGEFPDPGEQSDEREWFGES
ncbi:DUF2637 domain-containing protein [Saccharopolyspora taberi]|uniref:DUF2637 domain-containing protein n=1 Tax=Saccharopolyspora taberi TaxID=60895 RepID=A0ABN3V0K0_9PSEU